MFNKAFMVFFLFYGVSVFADECIDVGDAILNTNFRGEINLYEAPVDVEYWKLKAQECSQTNKKYNWSLILSQAYYKYTPDKIKKKRQDNFDDQLRQYKYAEERINSKFNSLKASSPASYEIESFSRQTITPKSTLVLHPKVYVMYETLEDKRNGYVVQLLGGQASEIQSKPVANDESTKVVAPIVTQNNISSSKKRFDISTDNRFLKELTKIKKELYSRINSAELDPVRRFSSLEKFNVIPPLIHQVSPEVKAKFESVEKEKIDAVNRINIIREQLLVEYNSLLEKATNYSQNIDNQYNKTESVLSNIDTVITPINTLSNQIIDLENLLANRDMDLEQILNESEDRELSTLGVSLRYSISKIESLIQTIQEKRARYKKKAQALALKKKKVQEQKVLLKKMAKLLEREKLTLADSNARLMPLDSHHLTEYIKRSTDNTKRISGRLFQQAENKDEKARKEVTKMLYVDAIKSMGFNFDYTIKSAVIELASGNISPLDRDALLGTAALVTTNAQARDALLRYGYITPETHEILEVSNFSSH